MGLTKSKGNMYSWVSHVWSPIRGCQFGCEYCYAKKYGYEGNVKLDEEDLKARLGKGKTIFVGHLCDMWGPWVSNEWIGKVVVRCNWFPENEYVFQSKNPARFKEWVTGAPPLFPPKTILGTTIETDRYPKGFQTKAPPIKERVEAMISLYPLKRFVTIEPIMDFHLSTLVAIIRVIDPEFVTIGSDSKGHGLVEPPWEKVELLINELNKFVEIRQKSNLERLKRTVAS